MRIRFSLKRKFCSVGVNILFYVLFAVENGGLGKK